MEMMATIEELARGEGGPVRASVLIEAASSREEILEGTRDNAVRRGGQWHTRQIKLSELEAEGEVLGQQRLEALLKRVAPHSHVYVLQKGGENPSPNVCIGRAKRNDVVLPGDAISSVHATFDWRNRQTIRDHKSSNGTFVNAYRLGEGEEVSLRSGDCVRLANSVFYYLTALHLEAFLDLYRSTR